MKRLNWKLLILCLAAFVLAAAVARGVYGAMPHIEDEHANVFQAKVFASGRITAPAPPVQPNSFFIPFLVNQDGQRFGKYPPGYSLLLVLGAVLDQWWLVNATAAALVVLGVYLLGRDLFDAGTGLLAAALGAIAPMFVLLSGALLSHVPAMALLTLFAWAFVRARGTRAARRSAARHPIGFALFAGFLLGLAFITRPWTTLAIGLPFALQALIDLFKRRKLWRVYASMLVVFVLIASLLPLYNYLATGSPLTNTYALWWSIDRLGFGPGIGVSPGGHNLQKGLINFRLDFPGFGPVLLGWPSLVGVSLAWLPVLAGLLWPPLSKREWGLMLPPILLIAAQLLYWARGSSFYGPRYYAEAMPFLWLIAARGLIKACAQPWLRRVVYVALPLLIAWNIVYMIEPRFLEGFNQYRAARHDLEVVQRANLQHALVFVYAEQWKQYADLAWLNAPDLDQGGVIYAYDLNPLINGDVIKAFPDRSVYYYDAKQHIPLVAQR